jgi:Mrp family chromosome partitioning ATPase
MNRRDRQYFDRLQANPDRTPQQERWMNHMLRMDELEAHHDERERQWHAQEDDPANRAPAAVGAGAASISGHENYHGAYSGRRYADELTEAATSRGLGVSFAEHPDAATAVTAAAAAVARANGVDPNQPVIVVVADDVHAACDEDGGF